MQELIEAFAIIVGAYIVIRIYKISYAQEQPYFSDTLSPESEELLSELTDLRLLQAETIAQIEDLLDGRTVQTTIKRQNGSKTSISSSALLVALKHEEADLYRQIEEKSVTFAKSMVRWQKTNAEKQEEKREKSKAENVWGSGRE